MMHRVNAIVKVQPKLLPRFAIAWSIALAALFVLAGCQAVPQARPAAIAAEMLLFHRLAPAAGAPIVAVEPAAPATPTRVSATEAVTGTTVVAASDMLTAGAPLTATTAVSTTTDAAPAEAAPAPAEQAAVSMTDTIPVSLTLPALSWSVPVVPMGWEAVLVDDVPTTRWLVPEAAGGWAVNSAAPGAPGNLIIFGQQALGEGLFRPFALGEVAVGDVIDVTGADGQVYRYQVIEVSSPIPAIGSTAEEQAAADAYLQPGEGTRLTVVTGWPGDVSTHRVFIVAEYAGPQ